MDEHVIFMAICNPDTLEQLVEELTDWVNAKWETDIIQYGITKKAKQGFLIMYWEHSVPENFIVKMQDDGDIRDYLLCPVIETKE